MSSITTADRPTLYHFCSVGLVYTVHSNCSAECHTQNSVCDFYEHKTFSSCCQVNPL